MASSDLSEAARAHTKKKDPSNVIKSQIWSGGEYHCLWIKWILSRFKFKYSIKGFMIILSMSARPSHLICSFEKAHKSRYCIT